MNITTRPRFYFFLTFLAAEDKGKIIIQASREVFFFLKYFGLQTNLDLKNRVFQNLKKMYRTHHTHYQRTSISKHQQMNLTTRPTFWHFKLLEGDKGEKKEIPEKFSFIEIILASNTAYTEKRIISVYKLDNTPHSLPKNQYFSAIDHWIASLLFSTPDPLW